jgi:hypothetical protein
MSGHTTSLVRLSKRWSDLADEVREAPLNLVAEHYLRLEYPNTEDLYLCLGVSPGGTFRGERGGVALFQAFKEGWKDVIHKAVANRLDCSIYIIVAGSHSGSVGVGAVTMIRGSRQSLFDQLARSSLTLIDGASDGLPTSRAPRMSAYTLVLYLNTYKRWVGQTWELSRLCMVSRQESACLVAHGHLTVADAHYIESHGLDCSYLGHYFNWDQKLAPVASAACSDVPFYYLAGAEPTPRSDPPFSLPYLMDNDAALEKPMADLSACRSLGPPGGRELLAA